MFSVEEMEEFTRINYNDPLAQVDDVVREWAAAQTKFVYGRGYARRDSSCADAVSSVQFQESDEVLEERLRPVRIAAVEGAMEDLKDPLHRAVIWTVYANKVGAAVWRHGLLKGMTKEAVRALLRDALQVITPLLRKRGLAV